jgi:hypothetical protein
MYASWPLSHMQVVGQIKAHIPSHSLHIQYIYALVTGDDSAGMRHILLHPSVQLTPTHRGQVLSQSWLCCWVKQIKGQWLALSCTK